MHYEHGKRSLFAEVGERLRDLAFALKRAAREQEELAAWLIDKSDPGQGSFQCTMFVLTLMSRESGAQVLSTFPVPKKLPQTERAQLLHRIAAEVDSSTKRSADMYPAYPSGFFVAGHLSANPEEGAFCQYPFVVTPSPDIAGAYESSAAETPNERGTLGQVQRLLNTTLNAIVAGAQSDKDRYLEEITEKNRHNERLLEENFKKAEKIEALLDARAEREVRTFEAKMDIELKSKLQMALLGYGKAFVDSHLAAKNGPPKQDTVVELAKSFKPKQFVDIMKTLDPKQKELIAPVLSLALDAMSDADKAELGQLMTQRATEEEAEIERRKAEATGEIQIKVVGNESSK